MGAYDFNFDLPAGETFIPRPERVQALLSLMPEKPFTIAPKADDRAVWSPWMEHPFGKLVLQTAREITSQPFPNYNNATWLASLEQRSTTKINEVHKLVRHRLTVHLLAEAMFDRGEFIPSIADNVSQIAKLNTWTHPNNDLKRLNYDGKTQEPDLHTVHFSETLGLTDFILSQRLPSATRTIIREEINRRLFAPLRERIESGRDLYWWLAVKHNWNAVCLATITHTAMAILPRAEERAWWLAFAQGHVINFRDSFTDDGFCTEGVAYWSYGFMHYVLLSELLRIATRGVVDLLDEPKMARAARFATCVEIQPNVYPTFADCNLDVRPYNWMRHWLDNRLGTPPLPTEPCPAGTDPFAGMTLVMVNEALLWMFRTRDPYQPMQAVIAPPLRNWFEQSMLLISRPGSHTSRQFAATFLGGHNGVNHNHNDLGTFTVILDAQAFILDPGLEVYSYRTFSEKRYDSQLLNSYGHPVPKVADQLQEAGAEWHARILRKEFTDDTDLMTLDLHGAYKVPGLRKLEREYLFDRRGSGSLKITDRVEFAEPSNFESALITLGEVAINGAEIIITHDQTSIRATVTAKGADLEFATDTINQPPHPKRIRSTCRNKVRSAVIETLIRPE